MRKRLFPQAALVIATAGLLAAPAAQGFGTINGLGQRAEHERITRAALACPPGTASTGGCFEPRSIDQLAGRTGTFGAVGAPDKPFGGGETFDPRAHCDDADFLASGVYPRTRAQATAQLRACVDHLRMRFRQGRDAAGRLLRADGGIDGPQVDVTTDCPFTMTASGRAKCDALEGFGRALHGAQDFYSHSNWTDQADPGRPISIDNPPGLNLTGPSPVLDLRGVVLAAVPNDLTTGYFSLIFPTDNCPATNQRITHACLNKDKALIDPVTGATSDPRTPRGGVLANAQRAVTGAIAETRRQWADLRAELLATYGAARGTRMIDALTRDVP